MRKTIIATIVLAIPTFVAAQSLDDAVKARQEHMKSYGKSIGLLAKMAKGEVDYDSAQAQAAADMIVELTQKDQSGYWLPGTSSDDMPGVSRALPAIWAEGSKIGEVAGKLPPAALALQEVAGTGRSEMAGGLGAVGNSCNECHKSFQQEKK